MRKGNIHRLEHKVQEEVLEVEIVEMEVMELQDKALRVVQEGKALLLGHMTEVVEEEALPQVGVMVLVVVLLEVMELHLQLQDHL